MFSSSAAGNAGGVAALDEDVDSGAAGASVREEFCRSSSLLALCEREPSSGRGGKGAPGRGKEASAPSGGGVGDRPGVDVRSVVFDARMLMPHWSYVSIFFIMFSYVSPILRGEGATLPEPFAPRPAVRGAVLVKAGLSS